MRSKRRKELACPERGGVNERQRVDGGVAAWLLLFTSTPQSRLRLDSSPINGGAFWCALHPLPLTLPQGRISHADRRISHGAAIFHIAIAIFHNAQAQFHRTSVLYPRQGFLVVMLYHYALGDRLREPLNKVHKVLPLQQRQHVPVERHARYAYQVE